jgi:hypothetical protein
MNYIIFVLVCLIIAVILLFLAVIGLNAKLNETNIIEARLLKKIADIKDLLIKLNYHPCPKCNHPLHLIKGAGGKILDKLCDNCDWKE